MKALLTILFLWACAANATTYYVSNSGRDSNNGTDSTTAWRTLAKVSSTTFLPDDFVKLKSGNVWNEVLKITTSGTAAHPITYSSYGIGTKPHITGFQTLTGLSNVGNIWSAIATSGVEGLNTVLYNGKIVAKGTYPNNNVLHWTTNLSDTGMTGAITTNYIGAEVSFYTMHWIIDVVKIKKQSNDTMTLVSPLTYPSPNYNAYFIQNSPDVLDVNGEWYINYDTKNFKIYSSSTPDVQVSVIDTLINATGRSYITFEGLDITGANKIALLFDTSHHIVIKNCTFNNNGRNALQGYPATDITVQNDSILNTLNDGARIFGPRLFFDGNYLKNIGHLAGMGASGNGNYIGLYCGDTSQTITNNRFDSSGYIPIYWEQGINSLVQENFVNYYSFIKEDGGGIHNNSGGAGSIIRKNIVMNGIGLPVVFGYGIKQAPGIYMDDGLSNGITNVTIDSNTTINTAFAGLYLHGNRYVNVYDNTFIDSTGYPIRIEQNYFTDVLNHNIRRNVFYSQSASFESFFSQSNNQLLADSNCYIRPIAEANKIKVNNVSYNHAGWSSYDTHAFNVPANTTTALPLIQYNATSNAINNSFTGTYISGRNSSYTGSITLQPFTSQLLFKAITDILNTPFRTLKNLKYRKINIR